MRIAVLSDAHGNAEALASVADAISREKIDALALLGDYVCDFPHPGRVMEILARLRADYPAWMLRGNREEYLLDHRHGKSDWWRPGSASGSLLYTYGRLTEGDLDLFESLPTAMNVAPEGCAPFTICHASPFLSREMMIRDDGRIRECLDAIPTRLLICGHTHETRSFPDGARAAHFVGSVGLPVFRGGYAQYAILDDASGAWTLAHRAVPYDIDRALAEFESSGLYAMGGLWSRAVAHLARTGDNLPDALARRAAQLAREAGAEVPPIPETCYRQAGLEIGLSGWEADRE